MSLAERIVQPRATRNRTRSELAVFRRMVGMFAEVNIGDATVQVPCDGFYPPIPGMSVRVQWVDGSPSVAGPARPLGARGTITGTGTPKATVNVDGVDYQLFVRSGYTPVVGHTVSVDWSFEGGLITGQVTGFETPTAPGGNDQVSKPFSGLVVRAAASGRYEAGPGWWGNDPWASSNNSGIWTYGARLKDALAGASVSSVEIYLPLLEERGLASVGTHAHREIPSGAPSIANLSALATGGRDGWVRLPNWGAYLASGDRGIGVVAPGGGGYSRWAGVLSDPSSGALRFSGTR